MKNTIFTVIISVILSISIMGVLKYPLDNNDSSIIKTFLKNNINDVIFDAIWLKMINYTSFFESLDGYAVSNATIDGTGVNLTTSATATSQADVAKRPSRQGLITFSQKSYFRSAFQLSQFTNQTAYLIAGGLDSGDYYGFKIVNGSVYGVVKNASGETSLLITTVSDTTASYNVEARYTPTSNVVFYFEANRVGVISTGLPSPALVVNSRIADFRITTSENVAKTMYVSFFQYMQYRNVLN